MKRSLAAVLAFVAAAAVPSAGQQTPTPTPIEQRVVAPSLPDQPNKEGVVRPSGSMPTDSEGYVRTNRGAVDPTSDKPTPPADTSAKLPAAPAPGPEAAQPAPAPGPGPAKVKAAYMSLRGTVKTFMKGVSMTIVESGGMERTVTLAAKASLYDGLAVGDKVVVRVPLGKPGVGMSADRVSKQVPPNAAPKSRFAAAQSPVR